mmetsp:Transcript_44265/g.116341  ORF Transcript_44265/g.116341 Transcript_44265/m.116341 type:complete len:204 (+) Transcript_44265:335-946(+)
MGRSGTITIRSTSRAPSATTARSRRRGRTRRHSILTRVWVAIMIPSMCCSSTRIRARLDLCSVCASSAASRWSTPQKRTGSSSSSMSTRRTPRIGTTCRTSRLHVSTSFASGFGCTRPPMERGRTNLAWASAPSTLSMRSRWHAARTSTGRRRDRAKPRASSKRKAAGWAKAIPNSRIRNRSATPADCWTDSATVMVRPTLCY